MNLVMTICMNYEFEIFERFIGSLFDSVDENVELVIFISKNDEIHNYHTYIYYCFNDKLL